MHAKLDATPRCVGEARRLTHNTLETWGLARLGEVAALLVSELTTNAILHARSQVAIGLKTNADGVRVDVCDDSPVPPQVRRFSADAATGRGVRLLQSLASSWGVRPRATGGKCVWFTLALAAPAPAVEWDFEVAAVEPL